MLNELSIFLKIDGMYKMKNYTFNNLLQNVGNVLFCRERFAKLSIYYRSLETTEMIELPAYGRGSFMSK